MAKENGCSPIGGSHVSSQQWWMVSFNSHPIMGQERGLWVWWCSMGRSSGGGCVWLCSCYRRGLEERRGGGEGEWGEWSGTISCKSCHILLIIVEPLPTPPPIRACASYKLSSRPHYYVSSTWVKPPFKTAAWTNINGFDSLMVKNTLFWSRTTKIEIR